MSEKPADLFAHARRSDPRFVPLAERMRPESLAEVVGQMPLTGPTGVLSRIVNAPRLPSLILWGPPGTGKTTLARLLARGNGAFFESLSATGSGVRDLREAVARARQRRDYENRGTILFVDEIHRFNKAQQDALLPHVEAGVCSLIGATTENPSFEVNAALLSRARVVRLEPLDADSIAALLRRALEDGSRGLGDRGVEVADDVLAGIAHAADGDARRALNALEMATDLRTDSCGPVTPELAAAALGQPHLRYDRAGEEHYNVASALIKSMRASDPDASVYWLARMLEAGDDPMFVARRIVIFASEDVGNADPQALVVANSAAQATHLIGMPEAVLPLTQAALYCALAPKSNSVLRAYFEAKKDVQEHGALEVPMNIRNAVTQMMSKVGYGRGYRYPHQFDEGLDPEHESHLPDALRPPAGTRRYAQSSPRGWERDAEARLTADAQLDDDESPS